LNSNWPADWIRERNFESIGLADCACLWVQNQSLTFRPAIEIEQTVQGAGDGVRGTIADAPQAPVVLDEAKDRGLVGHGVVHIIALRPGRNHQQRLPRTVAAAPILAFASRLRGLRGSAISCSEKLVIRDIRLSDDRSHLVVVPAI